MQTTEDSQEIIQVPPLETVEVTPETEQAKKGEIIQEKPPNRAQRRAMWKQEAIKRRKSQNKEKRLNPFRYLRECARCPQCGRYSIAPTPFIRCSCKVMMPKKDISEIDL